MWGHVEIEAPLYQMLLEVTYVCHILDNIFCEDLLLPMHKQCYILLNIVNKSVENQGVNILAIS
jgi:hypothetical protein